MKPLHFVLCLGLCSSVACEEKPKAGAHHHRSDHHDTGDADLGDDGGQRGNPDDGEGIPTEEDFEDEAEQKITSQNADDELDKLEREISN